MSQLILALAAVCALQNGQSVTPDVQQYDQRSCVSEILDCLNRRPPGPIAYAQCIRPAIPTR